MDKESGMRNLQTDLGAAIDRDLEFLVGNSERGVGRRQREGQTRNEDVTFRDRDFASLLVNVAIRSVGLEASGLPFNESPESMLAYLMDVLRLSENEIETLLSADASHRDTLEMADRNISPKKDQPFSFQPELRLRLKPLAMHNVGDLLVEVYLIGGQAHDQTIVNQLSVSNDSRLESSGIADIMKMRDISQPGCNLVNKKLLAEIRFAKVVDGRDPEVICLDHDLASTNGADVGELRIRLRHSIQRPSNQVVELDFIYQDRKKTTSIRRLLNMARTSCCSTRGGETEKLTGRMPTYGSTHIKVSQIPAYAVQLTRSVTSSRNQEIDHCDMILELRNSHSAGAPSLHEVILNHVRLYSIFIASQLNILNDLKIIFSPSYFRTKRTHRTIPNLDGLLRNPALTIINQHRLQFNISQLEDQSLRRSAILLLLTRIVQFSTFSKSHLTLLITVAEHEYLNAHRHFNNTTRQEIDPFHPKAEFDDARDQVKTVEYNMIQAFTNTFLCESHVRGWISRVDSSNHKPRNMEFLEDLRLVRIILGHNESNARVDSRFKDQSVELRIRVNNMIARQLSDELRVRLASVVDASIETRQEPQTKRKGFKPRPEHNPPINPWQKLFGDIQMIENDMMMHWSERGIESVKPKGTSFLPPLENDESLNTLRNFIQVEISNYLKSK